MQKLISSTVSLIDEMNSDDNWREMFCEGCENRHYDDETGFETCDADFEPSDRQCLWNHFYRDRAKEILALQHAYEDVLSCVPSDERY
jgi:hypothetical protein